MVLAEVDHLGFEKRTILDRLAHVGWKLGFVRLSAVWASFDLRLMFGHFNLYRRQIKDLATLIAFGGRIFQRIVIMLAVRDAVYLDVIGMRAHLQGMTLVARLSPAFLTA